MVFFLGRNEGHFEDVDYLLHLMSELEFEQLGAPVDGPALRHFNRTALSPLQTLKILHIS